MRIYRKEDGVLYNFLMFIIIGTIIAAFTYMISSSIQMNKNIIIVSFIAMGIIVFMIGYFSNHKEPQHECDNQIGEHKMPNINELSAIRQNSINAYAAEISIIENKINAAIEDAAARGVNDVRICMDHQIPSIITSAIEEKYTAAGYFFSYTLCDIHDHKEHYYFRWEYGQNNIGKNKTSTICNDICNNTCPNFCSSSSDFNHRKTGADRVIDNMRFNHTIDRLSGRKW